MTVEQDLRTLVDVTYPETVANLNLMLTNLNLNKTANDAEITTIEDGVLAASISDHLAKLEVKRVANGWDYVTTWGTYGVGDIKNDWAIWDLSTFYVIGLVRLGNDSFRIDSLTPPTFPDNSPIRAQVGDVDREVLSTVTDPGVSVTVTLKAGTPLPNPLGGVQKSIVVYQYLGTGWDSDAGLLQAQGAFDLGYSQLNDPVSLTGTYGLYARRDNINLGISVQTDNRDKYEEFIVGYESYAA